MNYCSTRGHSKLIDFDTVLLSGLAEDGGLYMPEVWPQLDDNFWNIAKDYAYPELVSKIMTPFIEGSNLFTPADIQTMAEECYHPFRNGDKVPLQQINEGLWALELFHGPTFAFKDYALQLLAKMSEHALKANDQTMTIIGATSGDTGSAAIEAYRKRENVQLFILHPHERVSQIQRRQMTTVDAPHIHNIAIEGSFDDCQDIVKALFNDHEFSIKHRLGAVNSINWVRILAQVVYYIQAGLALDCQNKGVNFVVPTGNFGNILAGWIARRLGLNISKLIIGSNQNDILTRFIHDNAMEITPVKPSLAPSMDIQISSNFERLLFELLGRDGAACKAAMLEFRETGQLPVSRTVWEQCRTLFHADCLDDQGILAEIKAVYHKTGYLCDPHTACGFAAANQYIAGDDGTPTVVLATAHPAKFMDTIKLALQDLPPDDACFMLPDQLQAVMTGSEKFERLPNQIERVKAFMEAAR